MWLFTTKGFLSAVQHNSKPDYYQIKSRVSKPLGDYWPEHEIQVIDWADYRFRIDVLKKDASSVITEILESIDYTSFKNNCEGFVNRFQQRCESVKRVSVDFQSCGLRWATKTASGKCSLRKYGEIVSS